MTEMMKERHIQLKTFDEPNTFGWLNMSDPTVGGNLARAKRSV